MQNQSNSLITFHTQLKTALNRFFLFTSIAPAKPEKPELEGTAVNKVRVYYKFGLGGGYTHEFLVMYRKKGKYFYNLTFLSLFRMKIKLHVSTINIYI